MKNWKSVLQLMAVIFILSACSARSMLIEAMKSRGDVVKEYDEGKDHYMIIKEGQRVIKYRLYDWSTGLDGGTQAEVIYTVDIHAQACFTGQGGQTPIDCEKIKKDPDIGSYIK